MRKNIVWTCDPMKSKEGKKTPTMLRKLYDILAANPAFGMWFDGICTVEWKIPPYHSTTYHNTLSMRTGSESIKR